MQKKKKSLEMWKKTVKATISNKVTEVVELQKKKGW